MVAHILRSYRTRRCRTLVIMRLRVTCSTSERLSPSPFLFLSCSLSFSRRNSKARLFSASCNRGFTRRLFICSARCTYERSRIPAIAIHTQRKRYKYYLRLRVRTRAHAHVRAHMYGTPNDPVNSPPSPALIPVIALLPLEGGGLLFIYGIHPEIQFGTCACSLR